jgi:hypothetical protein
MRRVAIIIARTRARGSGAVDQWAAASTRA